MLVKRENSSAKPPENTELNASEYGIVWENKSYIFANKCCTYIEGSVLIGSFPNNMPPSAKTQSKPHQFIMSMTNY